MLGEVAYAMNGGVATAPMSDLWRRLTETYANDVVEPLRDLERELCEADGPSGMDVHLAARSHSNSDGCSNRSSAAESR